MEDSKLLTQIQKLRDELYNLELAINEKK